MIPLVIGIGFGYIISGEPFFPGFIIGAVLGYLSVVGAYLVNGIRTTLK